MVLNNLKNYHTISVYKMARKTKASTATEAKNTVVEHPVATKTLTEETAETDTPTLHDAFTTLIGQLNTLRSQISTLNTELRTLRTRADREIKQAQKAGRRRRAPTGDRKPSGFVKPGPISKELAAFLGKPSGTEMARTEVTREINAYVRANNLQDPTNGRRIIADAKLRKLLNLKKSDELTYFNLQRFMRPHYPSKSA